MSLVTSFMTGSTAEAIASALMHFLWQGAVLAAAAWIAMRLTSSASARHAIGIVTLATMLAMPVATFLLAPAPRASTPAASAALSVSNLDDAPVVSASLPPAGLTTPTRILPYVTLVWLVGVFALSVRLAGGWIVARRLASRTVRGVDGDIERLAARMAERLGVRRFVRLAESSTVAVPMVVGWLKPVVLVPAAALSGLTTVQLEALFAHELAHIRRHDYLVNLLQSVVETLLFYHPAVWWMSARVREEREHCCDDLAVSVCDRVVYVDALSTLAAMDTRPRLALAATDGSLVRRVRRLLNGPTHGSPAAGWPAIVVAAALVAVLMPSGVAVSRESAAGEEQQPTAAPVPRPATTAPQAVPAMAPAAVRIAQGPVAALPSQVNEVAAQLEDARSRLAEHVEALARLTRERREFEMKRIHDEIEVRAEAKQAEIESVAAQLEYQQEQVNAGLQKPVVVAELRALKEAVERQLRQIEAELKFASDKHALEALELEFIAEYQRAQQMHARALEAQAGRGAYAGQAPPPPPPPRASAHDFAMQQLNHANATLASARLRLAAGHPDLKALERLVQVLSDRVDAEARQAPVSAAPSSPPPSPPPPPDFARLRVVTDRTVIESDDVFLASVESRGEPLRVITERGSGSITLPVVGSMRLEGMTVSEARDVVREAIARRTDGVTVRLWVYREN